MPKYIRSLLRHISINQQAQQLSSRNNILKALAGTSWGQQKETLLMTYKAVERSNINYAEPVWSTNLRDTNYRNIQYTQNEALRIAIGCYNISSLDHLQVESETNQDLRRTTTTYRHTMEMDNIHDNGYDTNYIRYDTDE